jgi:hypothetical protein
MGRNPRALKIRISSLVERISAFANRPEIYLDEEFRGEINELLDHARKVTTSASWADTAKLREYRAALEAVLAELEALSEDVEVGGEGA